MKKNPASDNETEGNWYVKGTKDRFFFDSTSGIYKPKAYKTKTKSEQYTQQSKQFLITTFISALTLLAVGIYAYYAALQWCEMKRAADASKQAAAAAQSAADTARDALVDVQRAFVSDAYSQNQDGNFWKITVKWENSGTTPTKDMTMHVSSSGQRSKPLPENFTFPDRWEPGEPHLPVHVTVPAKGRTHGMDVQFPVATITNDKEFYYYIWGWARYHDVFPKTTEHSIQFCEEFSSTRIDPKEIQVTTLNTDACARHNCIEEECKQN